MAQGIGSGRAVLVTGTSTGIGKATAERLHRAGYVVYAAVRSQADADRALSGTIPLLLDVTKPELVAAAAARLEEDLGQAGLFALVNNAGINYNAPLEHTDEVMARHLMETNLFGVAWLTKALLPALRRHAQANGGTARIVNLGSIGSLVGVPWEPFYHAAKFGLLGLSESLQHETWRQRIRVSVVMPGAIQTPFVDKTRDEILASARALPDSTRGFYEKSMVMLAERSEQVERFGSPPEKVAARIEALLRAKRPPFRALVGRDAHLINALRTWLPTSAYHRLMRAAFTS